MSTYSLQVPDGPKPHHCERPGSDYRELSIRFIMPPVSEKEIRTVTIKLPDGNRQILTVFDNGNAEMYIRTMKDHENLVSLNGSSVNTKEALMILKQKHVSFMAANAVANPTPSQRADIDRLKDRKEERST